MKFMMIILFILCLTVQMQLPAQYTIPSSVLGNGGTPIAGEGYQINGTVGQPLIGINTGTSDRVYVGFWNTIQFKITGVIDEPGSNLSSEYNLGINYPNPFNARTTITYELSRDSHINLSVFNVLGELVITLVNETKQAGRYTVDWNANNSLSGTYFCRLDAGDKSETRILQLLR